MTTPESKPEPKPEPKAKPKKPRRWRRRIIIALVAVICLVLLFRAVLTMLLPSVINKVARTYNLKIDYDRIDLHLIDGNAAIWDFRVLPLEGGEPILHADFLQGDISVIGLLKGRLVVYRAAADGVDLAVERHADGTIPLLKRFMSTSTAPTSAAPPPNSPSPASFQPPLRIDALRFEHIRARFRDRFVKPNVDARLALDLRLSNLGIAGEPARFELEFSSDPILDTLRIYGDSTADATQLNARLNVLMRGLHLKPAEGYLAAFGLHPNAENINAAMTGNLVATLAQNPTDGIKATLKLDNARLSADGIESAALDHLTATVDSLTAGAVKVTEIDIDGVRANASRNLTGYLAFAGIALVPPTTQPVPSTAPQPAAATTSSPFQVSLGSFYLSGLQLGLTDQSVSPPVTLALNSKHIEIADLHSNDTRDFKIDLGAPGLVEDIRLTGHAVPFSATKNITLNLRATGINPSAIKPYLDASGLASEWHDGSFSLDAGAQLALSQTGQVTANAELDNLRLTDNGADLLRFSQAIVKNAVVDPQSRTVSIEAVTANGPGLRAHRDADGSLHILGFKTVRIATAPQAPAATAPAASPSAAPPSLPFDNVQLTAFKWDGVSLQLRDDAVSPPADLAVGLAIEAGNIAYHRHKTGGQPQTGKFSIHLDPTDTSSIAIEGNLTPSPDRTTCDFNIHGQNLNADKFASYLKPLGIQPALKHGSLDCQGKAILDITSDRPKLSLALNGLKYTDNYQPLASIASLAVNNLSPTNSGLSLDSITIQSPHAVVLRTADGIVQAGGFRFVPVPAAPQPAIDPPADPPSSPSTFTAALKSLKISDVAIDWIDQSKNVLTTLALNADLTDFNFAPDANPALFNLTAGVAGSVDSLTATGALLASPASASVNVAVTATGMRPGPAVAYLPTRIRGKIKDGTLRATIVADLSKNPNGGQLVDVTVKDVDYRDLTDPAPLLAFNAFHLSAPRVDPAANVIALDDLSLTGLQTNIRKTATGIDLLGLEVAPNSAPSDPPPAPAAKNDPLPPPAAAPSPTSAPSQQDILRQVAGQRAKLPYVTLRNLDINAQKIAIFDETKPDAKPLTISDLRLHNPKPISLLGNDPESNAPTEISLTGRIDPIADNFTVITKSSPFARQKNFKLDLTVSGIHGQGLVDVDPSLAKLIEGDQLQTGQIRATLLASLKLQTVRPTDFDLSHGGKLDFSLTDLAFRADPQGPILAGIGEIHSEGIVLSPNLAGIDVRELEIDNTTGRGEKKSDGIHVCGLILKTPTTQPAASDAGVIKASTTPPAPVQPAPAAPSSAEYKIDRLLVSGIDFRVEDQTCTPPAIIPINSLDLEAQNLSSLATTQDKPVRFNLLASADKVPLMQSDRSQPANRELFSQIAASGVVSLYPNIKGWTKLSLNGFELTGVRGIAEQENIKIGAGTFDTDIDIRFPGDGSADTSTRVIFTDLSLSEPANGLISRTLKLPAPLDFVIGAIQDQDGSITIPLNVPIEKGHIDAASVTASAVGALGEIIGTAIASSPLKVAGLFGLNSKPDAQPPAVITFPPGYSALVPDELTQLNAILQRLRKDEKLQATLRSDAGKSDVTLARARVNPAPDEALVLATALSRRRDELLAARQEAAAQVRAWLASNDADNTARGIERLRNIDRQLYDTENAMDQAYDLLRPGADRQATRRTRAAVLALGRARLESVQKFLEGSGKESISPDRIRATNPQFNESPRSDTGTVTVTILKTK